MWFPSHDYVMKSLQIMYISMGLCKKDSSALAMGLCLSCTHPAVLVFQVSASHACTTWLRSFFFPADVLAPSGTWLSSSTVLTTMLYIYGLVQDCINPSALALCSSRFFWLSTNVFRFNNVIQICRQNLMKSRGSSSAKMDTIISVMISHVPMFLILCIHSFNSGITPT